MKSYLKKSISLILSLMMTLSMMPSLVFALDEPLASENIEAQVSAEEQTEEDTSDEVEEPSENENAEVDKAAEDNQETAAVESSEEDGSEDSDSESSTDTETVKETAPAGEKTEEAKEDTAEEVKMPAFNQSKTSDGVKITVRAAEGTFPEGAYLDVRKATEDEAARTDKAVELKRGDNVNVALTYTFDIKVLDKDGKELQPEEGQKVEVLFTADEVSNENLSPAVYHIKDEGNSVAEALDINEKDDTVSAETDGFSYYTVEFTYGDLEYSMSGDSEIPLSTILDNIGLSGTVTEAVSSNPELFSVDNKDGEWTVTANKAFQSEETLTVTIDGTDYVIKVTDDVTADPHDHKHTGWTAWNNTTSLPNTAGKYYLAKDVTLNGDCYFNNSVELCLNGHTITMTGNGKYIGPASNKTLTIYDEPGNSGRIVLNNNRFSVNGVFNLYGGTVKGCTRSYEGALTVSSGGTFNMYGGVFSGNTSGAVLQTSDSSSRLNIYGGEITDNTVDSAPVYASYGTTTISGGTISGNTGNDGAVYATGNGKTYISGGIIKDNIGRRAAVLVSGLTSLYLSGNVYISGNKLENGKECNVKLDSNNYRINISGELTNTTPIGITAYTPPTGDNTVEFTTGLNGKGTAANFSSDNPNCAVTIKNNEAHLVNHSHTFNYTAAGDTITAECVNKATPCSLPDNKTTLKIVKPARTVYGGSGSAEATFEGTIPGVTPAAEYYKGTEKLSAAPTNAGTYKAQVTLKGSDEKEATAFVDYTIAKADISPVVEIDGWDYGDTPNEPSVTAASNPGSGTVTYEYYTDEACTQKTTSAQGAKVDGGVPSYGGDYWVEATVEDTANYNSGTGKKAFKINATEVKVKGLKFTSKVYDGTTSATLDANDATLVGVKPGDVVSIKSATGTFNDKNVGTGKTISSITIVLEGKDAGGYKATADSATLQGAITARPVTVSGIKASNKTYDGNTTAELTFTGASFAEKIEEDTLTVEGKEIQTGTFDNKNVGNGKTVTLPELKLGGESADNYSIKDDSQTEAKANITAKAINVTAVDKSKTFDEKDPELTYTADALVTGDEFTGALERAKGEDVGNYDINQGTLTAGDNYTISYKKGTFTINKATTNSVTASIKGWTYGDNPNKPSATATYGQDTVTFAYSDSEDGEYKSEVPKDAGTWYVKATVPETANYVGVESTPVEFTIAQKEVGLEWSDTELTYNGNAQKPKATAKGLVDGDECDVTVEGEETDANAKTGTDDYTATATGLSNDNYKLPENNTTTFSIAPKEITKSMLSVSPAEIKGDGSEQGPTFAMEDQDVSDPAMKEGEDFELMGETKSSVNGTHFVTVEGKGNYTGSLDTSWMMYNKKSNNEKEPGTDGRGDFEIFVDINQNTEAISVSDFTIDMAKKLLSDEEFARYNEGENVTVYLEVLEEPKSAVNNIDKSLLDNQFKTAAAKDIRWFDITVWKKVGNDAATQVHDIGSDISINVEVPDEFKIAPSGYTRMFYFGRAHEGEASIIKQTADVNVSFASHLFSTYAMAYKDTKIPNDKDDSSGDDGSGNNSDGNSSGSNGSGGVKTGDSNKLIPWTTALACALAAGFVLNRRRKNEE